MTRSRCPEGTSVELCQFTTDFLLKTTSQGCRTGEGPVCGHAEEFDMGFSDISSRDGGKPFSDR